MGGAVWTDGWLDEAGKQSIIDKLTRLRRNCLVVPLLTLLSISLNNTLRPCRFRYCHTLPVRGQGRAGTRAGVGAGVGKSVGRRMDRVW